MAIINGQEVILDSNTYLTDYLFNAGFDITKIAVEINGNIISKKLYNTTIINNDDKIEVVTFVGGG